MAEKQSSNLPTVSNTLNSMMALIKQHENQFAMVLPKNISLDRFIRITRSTIIQNPKLIECNSATFLRALLNLASLGLEPGGPLGLAHLVPFWNGKENRLDCQSIIDYKGYIALGHRSQEVGRITAHIIYEKEPWEFSAGDVIIHKPLPPSERGTKKVLVYAKAFDKGGTLVAQEFLWAEEVEEIKKKSLGNKKNVAANPWNTNEEAMWRKSPVRRMAKWMPMAAEMQTAARIEEAQEEGFDLPLDVEFAEATGVGVPATGAEEKTASKANALKDRLFNATTTAEAPAEDTRPSEHDDGGLKPDYGGLKPGVEGAEAPPELPPLGEPPHSFSTDPGGSQEPPPPPPTQEPPPERKSKLIPPKPKPADTVGPSKGPRIEIGKKAESYWIDTNMIRCPPGGTREGQLTNVKSYCNAVCEYRKRCFLFKD